MARTQGTPGAICGPMWNADAGAWVTRLEVSPPAMMKQSHPGALQQLGEAGKAVFHRVAGRLLAVGFLNAGQLCRAGGGVDQRRRGQGLVQYPARQLGRVVGLFEAAHHIQRQGRACWRWRATLTVGHLGQEPDSTAARVPLGQPASRAPWIAAPKLTGQADGEAGSAGHQGHVGAAVAMSSRCCSVRCRPRRSAHQLALAAQRRRQWRRDPVRWY